MSDETQTPHPSTTEAASRGLYVGEEGEAQPNTTRDKLQHYRTRVLKHTLPG